MQSRLSKAPDGPTVIAANSVEEALAFLSQLFGESGGKQLQDYRDRVLVFKEPGVLPRLAQERKTSSLWFQIAESNANLAPMQNRYIPLRYIREIRSPPSHI